MLSAHSTRTRIGLVGLVLGLSIIFRIARGQLIGVEDPVMTVWPSQVIFGIYFAILVLAIQGLQDRFAAGGSSSSKQALLMLVLIGLCLDLVLVNIQETITHVDASYGLVVLWDVATFFAWLRVVDLCRPGAESRFRASWIVAIAPLFKLGREILFLPYSPMSWRAYLDLGFGDLLVCLWVFVPLTEFGGNRPNYAGSRGRVGQILSLIVFTGCGYWILNAVENVAFLAWSPLPSILYRSFAREGIPVPVLSCLYILIASSATFAAWRWNVFRIGACFGIK